MDDLEPKLVPARLPLQACRHLDLDFAGHQHLVPEAALVLILCALGRMGVRVNDARQYHSTREIDAPGHGTFEGTHVLISADGDDRVAADGERLSDAAARILGMDPAVKEDEIGRLIRGGSDERARE